MKPMLYSPECGFNGMRYFPKELRPRLLKVGQKTFTQATRYEHHEHLEYLFIRSGAGTVKINDAVHPIRRGDALVFKSWDFHKFIPAAGRALTIDYCQISIGTYFYFIANPYHRVLFSDFDRFYQHPSILHFEECDNAKIERLFEQLRAMEPSAPEPAHPSVYYAMELIGRYLSREQPGGGSLG